MLDVPARGEHEDGDAGGEGVALDGAADVDAGHAGHHEIEHQELGLAVLDGFQRGVAVRGQTHLVPRRFEDLAHHQAHVLVVVDAQQVTHD